MSQSVPHGLLLYEKRGLHFNVINSFRFFILNKNFLFSFNKLLLQKEELEQKHVHLLQVVESEKTAKWQYTQQCEELASEIKKLRAEVYGFSFCCSRSNDQKHFRQIFHFRFVRCVGNIHIGHRCHKRQ